MLKEKIFYTNVNNEIREVKLEKCIIEVTNLRPHTAYSLVTLQVAVAGLGSFLYVRNCNAIFKVGEVEMEDGSIEECHTAITPTSNTPNCGINGIYLTIEDAINGNSFNSLCRDNNIFFGKVGLTLQNIMDKVSEAAPDAFRWTTITNVVGMKLQSLYAYTWDGLKAIPSTLHSTITSDLWQDNSYRYLLYDLANEILFIDGADLLVEYYPTAEECAQNNHIKVHTFA